MRAHNILTIGDVARADPNTLRAVLGKCGETLYTFANGLDQSPVARYGDEAMIKSVGNSTTTPRDLIDDDDVRHVIYLLAESVGERLREHRIAGSVVSLSVRDNALATFSCQRKLRRETALASEISACAIALFRESYRWVKPVRSLGVSVSALRPTNGFEQISMFPDMARARRYELERAIDDVRGRYGHFAIQRAVFLAERDIGVFNPKAGTSIQPFGQNAVNSV